MSQNGSPLDARLAALLDRRRARNQLRALTTVPPGAADFSSNGYLSLSTHPAVQAAFLARLQEQAPKSLLGSGGSRLLDGNSSRAEQLERTIAAFHRAPAGLLFNSALDANMGLFGCAPQPGDAVVYDELIHASVHDGMRLSRVSADRRVAFAHNCVWDNEKNAGGKLKPLETVLLDLQTGVDGHLFKSGERNVFIAVEGVYSMDGDVAPLKDIVECVSRSLPAGNGYLIVDEAHSTGIFGDRGRGLVCELGLENGVWARVLGFGKAMGCSGGIVLCSETTRSYLINYARSLIYTTAMGFPALAAIEVTYDFMIAGRAEPLLANLRSMVRLAHTLLLGPKSPIIPVFTSQPRSLARYCQRRGFMVRPIVAPTVPLGSERIRVCIHAGNTHGEVEGLVAAVEEWVVAGVSKTRDNQEGAGKVALTSPSKGRRQTGEEERPKL
ncbi:pyridoxal phosphate-dependent transferase [Coniochaeta sp. 2T2.1]|nr:pyridoxal phosphate-dependent transferase [Coniochaeta sp. 2T2.1]